MLTDGLNDKVFIEKEGQTRKLMIRSISVHDDGEYTCSLGDQECTAEINVIGIGIILEIILAYLVHNIDVSIINLNNLIFLVS